MEHQRWRALLDARAAAFDNPAAETNAMIQRLVSLKREFAEGLLETIYSLFDSLPVDVAIRESVALIQQLIERDTTALKQMVREVTPEEAGAVIGYFERDISLWKKLIEDIEETDYVGKGAV